MSFNESTKKPSAKDFIENEECFFLYVEEEDIGKKIKNSKKRIRWLIGIGNGANKHDVEIELKHSVLSGKHEIRINADLSFQSSKMKSFFSDGDFNHTLLLPKCRHSARVIVKGLKDSFYYNLQIDGIDYNLLKRSRNEAEKMDEIISTSDFSSFVSTSQSKKVKGSSMKNKELKMSKSTKEKSASRKSSKLLKKLNTKNNLIENENEAFDPFASTSSQPVLDKVADDTFSPFDDIDVTNTTVNTSPNTFDPFSTSSVSSSIVPSPLNTYGGLFDPFSSTSMSNSSTTAFDVHSLSVPSPSYSSSELGELADLGSFSGIHASTISSTQHSHIPPMLSGGSIGIGGPSIQYNTNLYEQQSAMNNNINNKHPMNSLVDLDAGFLSSHTNRIPVRNTTVPTRRTLASPHDALSNMVGASAVRGMPAGAMPAPMSFQNQSIKRKESAFDPFA